MNKIFIAAVLALALAGGAIASGASQNTSYVAKNPPLTIWCGAGGHNYAPIGDPGDYDDELSWLFSGEPECLPGDALFGEEDDHGWGGAAFCVAGEINGNDCGDHRTHALLAQTTDALGSPLIRLSAEVCPADLPDCTTQQNTPDDVVTAEGCGTTGFDIPADMARHWQSPSDNPTYLVWALVHGAHVDPASGAVCVGSQGVITGDW